MVISIPPPSQPVVDLGRKWTDPWYSAFVKLQQGVNGSIFVNLTDKGAIGNGSTDDTQAINGAIDSLPDSGGIVYAPPGNYGVSEQIDINKRILLLGSGTDQDHGATASPDPGPATVFTWIGATDASKAVFNLATVYSPTAPQLIGCVMQDFAIDGDNKVGIGLRIDAVGVSKFQRLIVKNSTAKAFYTICGTSSDTIDQPGVQYNDFDQCGFFVSGASHGFHLDGSPNGNTSFNSFRTCVGLTENGHGFFLDNADNNTLISCNSFPTGTGYSFYCAGFNSGVSTGGDSNYFIGCSWGTSQGVRLAGTGDGYPDGTSGNCFISIDRANSSAYPELDTGSSFHGPLAFERTDRQVPVNGFSIAFPNATRVLVLEPAGGLATGTITVPSDPFDGQIATICSTQTITTLTVNASGQGINGAPSTIAANTAFHMIYNLSNNSWYRG